MAKFVTLGEFCVRPEAVVAFKRSLKQYHLLSLREAQESSLEEEWELVIAFGEHGMEHIPDPTGEMFFRLKRAMEAG